MHRTHFGFTAGLFVCLATGTLTAWSGQEKQACNVTAVITRTVAGTTDPTFDSDSRFQLHQVRQARFVCGP